MPVHRIQEIFTEVQTRLIAVTNLGATKVYDSENAVGDGASLPYAWFEFEGGDVEEMSASDGSDDRTQLHDENLEVSVTGPNQIMTLTIMSDIANSLQVADPTKWSELVWIGWSKQPKDVEGKKGVTSVSMTFAVKYETLRSDSSTSG